MIIMVVVRTNNIDGVDDTGDEEQQSEEAVEPEGASTALVEENGNGLKIKVVRAITSVDSGAEPNCVLSIFVDFVSHRTSAGKRVWQLLTHSQKTGKPR